ncbi:MAG: YeeE/YedE thiosulfate transporter family protein [Longimicrobiaceae bacterium]
MSAAAPGVPARRPYADPHLAGVGVGLVLLLAFVATGRGLGASGAFAAVAASGAAAAAPGAVAGNPAVADYLAPGGLLRDWLVVEVAGVFLGGFLSAAAAGRLRLAVERGPRMGVASRLALGFGGGVVMALGARWARGCTSGLGLTGASLLAAGSWLFLLAAFAAAYAATPLLRRAWT